MTPTELKSGCSVIQDSKPDSSLPLRTRDFWNVINWNVDNLNGRASLLRLCDYYNYFISSDDAKAISENLALKDPVVSRYKPKAKTPLKIKAGETLPIVSMNTKIKTGKKALPLCDSATLSSYLFYGCLTVSLVVAGIFLHQVYQNYQRKKTNEKEE